MSPTAKEAEMEGDTFLLLTASQTAHHMPGVCGCEEHRGTKKWLNNNAVPVEEARLLRCPGDAFSVGCEGLGASAGSLQQCCVIPVRPATQCEGADDDHNSVV